MFSKDGCKRERVICFLDFILITLFYMQTDFDAYAEFLATLFSALLNKNYFYRIFIDIFKVVCCILFRQKHGIFLYMKVVHV